MDAGERCVETVEKIVDVGFLRTARISVSHRSPFTRR